MTRLFLTLGSLLGAVGVGLGAFGAHALRSRVDARMLEVWETAVRYHLIHALALLAAAWVVGRQPGAAAAWAGWLFVVGVAIFSGCLYGLVLTGQRWLGAVTPLGGVALIAGWLAMAWAGWHAAGG